MSSNVSSFTIGELAKHKRGKTLAASFGAEPVANLPHLGVCFAFGKDFQENEERARSWTRWCETGGRVLVLVPPFARPECTIPIRWSAQKENSIAGGDSKLSQLLAAERQHSFRGSLLPIERVGGALTVAAWRKHPAAGLIVWCALPLWSLTVLDHSNECQDWLNSLYEQAGEPAKQMASESADAEYVQLSRSDWSVLLHYCTGPYADDASALDALQKSSVIEVAKDDAKESLKRLTSQGLVYSGSVSQKGDALLDASKYSTYAKQLRSLPCPTR